MAHIMTRSEIDELYQHQLDTPRSVDELMLFITRKVISGTNYSDALDQAEALIQAGYVGAQPQPTLFGNSLGTYQGLSRQQIKEKFGLTDANVDTIFTTAGIVE